MPIGFQTLSASPTWQKKNVMGLGTGMSRNLFNIVPRLAFVTLVTGSPHIRLEQTNFIGRVLSRLLRARGLLVRGLEPKLRNRSEPARRSNIVTRDETQITAFQISH